MEGGLIAAPTDQSLVQNGVVMELIFQEQVEQLLEQVIKTLLILMLDATYTGIAADICAI